MKKDKQVFKLRRFFYGKAGIVKHLHEVGEALEQTEKYLGEQAIPKNKRRKSNDSSNNG